MRKTALAIATAVTLSLTGAALAQTGSAGSATDNMNNPGSVKSNSEKAMPESTGTAGSRMAPGSAATAPGATGTMAPGAATSQPMAPGSTQPAR